MHSFKASQTLNEFAQIWASHSKITSHTSSKALSLPKSIARQSQWGIFCQSWSPVMRNDTGKLYLSHPNPKLHLWTFFIKEEKLFYFSHEFIVSAQSRSNRDVLGINPKFWLSPCAIKIKTVLRIRYNIGICLHFTPCAFSVTVLAIQLLMWQHILHVSA